CYDSLKLRLYLAVGLLAVGVIMAILFFIFTPFNFTESLLAIAKNEGKHPPELHFMLFSMMGAFAILAMTVAGGEILPKILKPLTVIGEDALQAFIFHIFVIFVVYRYLLGYWNKVSYENALWLSLLLIFMTPLWIRLRVWMLKHL
ncbi:MAG: OpgC domain-containing protein, partial [Bdellovibrio sp.]